MGNNTKLNDAFRGAVPCVVASDPTSPNSHKISINIIFLFGFLAKIVWLCPSVLNVATNIFLNQKRCMASWPLLICSLPHVILGCEHVMLNGNLLYFINYVQFILLICKAC